MNAPSRTHAEAMALPQQNIGNTSLQNAQAIVGNVSGSVYFSHGREASQSRSDIP